MFLLLGANGTSSNFADDLLGQKAYANSCFALFSLNIYFILFSVELETNKMVV